MTDLMTLPQLEIEIKFYLGQTAQNIIEVGKRLIQAKSLVQHGHWQNWLNDNFQLGQSAANKFMSVAERFGNSDTCPNLKSSQMVAMLSLPDAAETEKFLAEKAAEDKNVADMTIKQLREEIADYKAKLDVAQKDFQQSLFDCNAQIDDLKQELKDRPTVEVTPKDYQDTKRELVTAQVELQRAKDIAVKQSNDFKELSDQSAKKIEDAEKEIKKLKQANERLKEKSYIPPVKFPADDCQLFCADIRDGLPQIKDNSVDFIITDPPYPKEFLPLYEDLSKLAARVLKDGGSLICMIGQSYLPDVIRLLETNLTYHWCLCYSTPGQKTQLWQRHLHTAWKPLLWFTKGEYKADWLGSDVFTSNQSDKRFHKWGQSLSGLSDIIERLTRPNNLILDPFLGGGSTALAALTTSRKFIGSDIDQKNIEVTNSRIKEFFNESSQI